MGIVVSRPFVRNWMMLVTFSNIVHSAAASRSDIPFVFVRTKGNNYIRIQQS